MKINKPIIPLLLLLLFSSMQLKAQSQPKEATKISPWYVGIKGGVPFGVSSLSSFGEDKTRAGYNFGAMVGYQINHIFSTEFSAMFGQVGLGSTKCCADYWLRANGVQYVSAVTGAQGEYLRNLYSSVSTQQYGLQLNVDIVQLIKRNDATRWSMLISPAIYGVGTCATIKKTADKSQLLKADKQFQFGAGGEVGVGYRITKNLGIRLSSGINCLIGNRYDGIPEGNHNENFIWNNNLSLSWRFGKSRRGKTTQTNVYAEQMHTPVTQPIKQPTQPVVTASTPIVENKQQEEVKTEQPITPKTIEPVVTANTVQDSRKDFIAFPIILYKFDDMEVRISQQEKFMQIFDILQANPKLRVTVTGYGDGIGSQAANDNISRLRANGVKYRLVKRGIDSQRIIAIGGGVATTDLDNARRAEVNSIKGE